MKKTLSLVIIFIMLLSCVSCDFVPEANNLPQNDINDFSDEYSSVEVYSDDSTYDTDNSYYSEHSTTFPSYTFSNESNTSQQMYSFPSYSVPSTNKIEYDFNSSESYSKTSTTTTSDSNTTTTYSKINYESTTTTAKTIDYEGYQREYDTLTANYNAKVSDMKSKIETCNTNISNAQKAINSAKSSLTSLSSECPQWYIQQYVNNWQQYGDTYSATNAARQAWTRDYNNQRTQLNNTISLKTSELQGLQTNLSMYQTLLSDYKKQYDRDVAALKRKYGI